MYTVEERVTLNKRFGVFVWLKLLPLCVGAFFLLFNLIPSSFPVINSSVASVLLQSITWFPLIISAGALICWWMDLVSIFLSKYFK